MGLHETIADATGTPDETVTPLDWAAFHATLEPAQAGPPFAARRRTVDLGRDIVVSATLEDRMQALERGEDDVCTTARFGDVALALTAPWQVMQALMDAHGIDQDCDILPATALSLVAEHLLAPVAKPLEQALGGTCRIWPETEGDSPQTHLHLRLVIGGADHGIAIATDPAAADTIRALFPPASPLPAIKVPDAVMMPIALHGAPVAMTAGTLATFGAGDVMLFEQGWSMHAPGMLTCAGTPVAEVAHDTDAQTLTIRALVAPDDIKRSPDMTTQTDAPVRAPATLPRSRTRDGAPQTPAAAPAALEGVNVVVSVELHRSEMPLGQVRQLSVGTVLPFDDAPPQEVTLLANGAPFATGELVRIGDRMGVRLSALD